MKTVIKGILLIFIIISCSKRNEIEKNVVKKNSDESKTEIFKKSIFPDFINLSNSDFKKFEIGTNSKWFKFKNQKLYFVPYTDYSVTTLYLTNETLKNNDLIALLKADKIIVEDSKNAIKTNEFITDKKIKLNVSKNYIRKIYGESDSIKSKNGKEILFWNFKMNENRKDYENGNLKPFVHNNLDFNIEMIFKNDSLTTLIYKYDVP